MKKNSLAKFSTPTSVLAATVVLFVYLMVARADNLGAAGSMFRAVFDYGLSTSAIGTFVLRSALVYLVAFSVVWPITRFVTSDRG